MINLRNKGVSSIGEVVSKIPPTLKEYNVVDLSDNQIKWAEIYKLPDHILHVNLYNNIIKEVNWGTREWGTINLGNNGLEISEISNLKCEKLELTDNLIEEITLICCDIGELIISNNSLKDINFVECYVGKLNLSSNKLTNITHLPEGLFEINLSSNRIEKICELPDTLMMIDFNDNKLRSIPNIPKNIVRIDVSKNKFKTFDVSNIPESLDYLDVTDNLIPKTNALFEPVQDKIENIYYDEDKSDMQNDVPENLDQSFYLSESLKEYGYSDDFKVLNEYKGNKNNNNYGTVKPKNESDDDNISLNVIPKKAHAISFDSISTEKSDSSSDDSINSMGQFKSMGLNNSGKSNDSSEYYNQQDNFLDDFDDYNAFNPNNGNDSDADDSDDIDVISKAIMEFNKKKKLGMLQNDDSIIINSENDYDEWTNKWNESWNNSAGSNVKVSNEISNEISNEFTPISSSSCQKIECIDLNTSTIQNKKMITLIPKIDSESEDLVESDSDESETDQKSSGNMINNFNKSEQKTGSSEFSEFSETTKINPKIDQTTEYNSKIINQQVTMANTVIEIESGSQSSQSGQVDLDELSRRKMMEIREKRLKGLQSAILRSNILVNTNDSMNATSINSINTRNVEHMMTRPLTEDEKILLEIAEANRSKKEMVFAKKNHIKLQWRLDL